LFLAAAAAAVVFAVVVLMFCCKFENLGQARNFSVANKKSFSVFLSIFLFASESYELKTTSYSCYCC